MIDYMKQLNAFNERCQVTGLAPRVRVVYYTLLDMNNRLFWVSPFKTTIRIIADRSGLNKNAVDYALRFLKNEGLIEYIPSTKKGTCSFITICPLYGTQTWTQTGTEKNICPDTGTQTGTESGTLPGTNSGTNSGTTIKQNKTKEDKTAASHEEVVTLFENCIHPVSNEVERDALIDMIQEDGYELVKDAIKEAAENRGRSVRYIQAILNRWRKEGKHGRGTGYRRKNQRSPEEEKRKWENEPNGWRSDLAI